MHIDTILDGTDALLRMERYVDEGTRTYSPFADRSEAAPRYQPRDPSPTFELVALRAPKRDVRIFQADPDRDLLQHYVRPDEVLFVVHPETWATAGVDDMDELRALSREAPVGVAPTASTRTVLTRGVSGAAPAHFIKLHYPRRISRFNRRLRLKNIRTSVEVTRDLAEITLERFAYLPDTLGMAYGDRGNGWGFLVREVTPRPRRDGRLLVPFFALYGGDLEHPEDRPLLVQMIERLGVEPCSFVVEEMMIPLVECWATVVQQRGILLESHAQNALLEVDRTLRPRRIVHRDFDVWIDAERRERAGLGVPFSGPFVGTDAAYAREAHYSLVYDHFLGRELLDYLLALLVRSYGVDEVAVRARVADAFHRSFRGADALFPPSTYYFSNEILPGNEFRLEETGAPPRWR